MLLCKVMMSQVRLSSLQQRSGAVTLTTDPLLSQPQDVATLILSKASLQYQHHREIEVMKEVAKAHEKRSLGDFENVLKTWKEGAFFPFHLSLPQLLQLTS